MNCYKIYEYLDKKNKQGTSEVIHYVKASSKWDVNRMLNEKYGKNYCDNLMFVKVNEDYFKESIKQVSKDISRLKKEIVELEKIIEFTKGV